MELLNRLAKNSYVTLTPDTPLPICRATQFRWLMHVSLAFPLPSRDCANPTATDPRALYELSIHNHFDRLLIVPKAPGGWPRITLLHKNEPAPPVDDEHTIVRERLQSTAILIERKLYASPNEAFADAANKVIAEWSCSPSTSVRISGPCHTSFPGRYTRYLALTSVSFITA